MARTISLYAKKPKDISLYPDRWHHILDDVRKINRGRTWPLFKLAAPKGTADRIYDLALIICSYGNNEERVTAIKNALEWMLRSKPMPNLYFVEAADEGNEYVFENYFKDYDNVTYIKKQTSQFGKYIWMKEALWTIGAKYVISSNKKITKLCFVDADVEFVDQMWAREVSMSLNKYDCISPHSHSIHEGISVKEKPLMPSMGFTANDKSHTGDSDPGMAFGCTVDFFTNRLNSRIPDVACGSGDTFLWYTILGVDYISGGQERLAYNYTYPHNKGMRPRPKVGHGSQIAIHRYHGPLSNRLYYQRKVLLKRAVEFPLSEYMYDDNDMPMWSDTIGGRILSRAYPEVYNTNLENLNDVAYLYRENSMLEYDEITTEYPLVIVCVLSDNSNEPISKVTTLKNQLINKCKIEHRFVCITNKDIPEVECIPTTLNIPNYLSHLQIFNTLDVDNKTSVLYCDLNSVIYSNIIPHRCPENSLNMIRLENMITPIGWGAWSSKVIYYRGDFNHITDKLNMSPADLTYYYVSAENMIASQLLKQDQYVTNIEPHVCCRFYNNNKVPSYTEIVAFYNVDPRSVRKQHKWIPDYL